MFTHIKIFYNFKSALMRRLVQILCIPELTPLPVMEQVFTELCGAFADSCNAEPCIVKKVQSLHELENGGIVFVHDEAGQYKNNAELYHRIGNISPDSVFICWYWRDLTFTPFRKMLHTGEYYLYLHTKKSEIADYTYMTSPLFAPLKLRANDSPHMIGTYPRATQRDYCFMGGGYLMDWIPENYTGIYHRVLWNNYLSYEKRREIYLSSTFAFGFQSDENVRTGHLSQRIFEGLAYGCIVLCNNPFASEYTDGIVVHVSSKEDLIEKMKYYKAYPEEIEKKQIAGYEWTKKYGTNRLSASLFLDKIYDVFGDKFGEKFQTKVQTQVQPQPQIKNEIHEPKKHVTSVNIMGGLGNQLFQIAAAYAYSKRHNTTLQILRITENGTRSLYWDTVFSKLQANVVGSLNFADLEHWIEPCATVYKEIDPPHTSKYLIGYMQSSKYFTDYKYEIRSLFSPTIYNLRDIYQKHSHILHHTSRIIVLHARQTDYLLKRDFHGPLDITYYKRALDKMCTRVENPILLLCGDDPSFWKQADFPQECIHLEDNDITTFYLLQQCQYFIMSNSTFIWWCTWLSSAKHVIAPAKWFGPLGPPHEDIYEDGWERV